MKRLPLKLIMGLLLVIDNIGALYCFCLLVATEPEYPNHNVKDQGQEQDLTGKEILFKHILVNKYVWFLAMAAIFVYFLRYGVLNWAPTYLTEMKGVKLAHSGLSFVIYEGAGIIGILLCGYMSDKWFKGRRAPVSMLCMTMVFIGLLLYWFSPSILVSYVALFIMGMFIYGPVMLLGVQLLDMLPKKTVGTAIGLIGLFAYWGGNMAATAGFGYIVDYFGWNGGFITLAISCALATFFFALTLGVKSVKKQSVSA